MKLPSRTLCKTLGSVQVTWNPIALCKKKPAVPPPVQNAWQCANHLEAPPPLQMKPPSRTLCKTLGNVQITWKPLTLLE